MPGWRCVLCKTGRTYRRDGKCEKCRPSKRGACNKRRPKFRMNGKQSLGTNVRYVASAAASPAGSGILKDWQHALESAYNSMLVSRLGFCAAHSVLSIAHALILAADSGGWCLPERHPSSELALVFCAMAWSTRIEDPDSYRPKWVREHEITMKSVTAAQCVWTNLVGKLDIHLLDC